MEGRTGWVAWLAGATLAGAAPAQELPRLSTVALTGELVPGLSGLTFASLADPAINERGSIVFWGQLAGSGVTTSNDGVVVLRRGGQAFVVGREGTAVALAGGGTSTVSGLPTAAIAANDSVLVSAGLVDASTGVNTNLAIVQGVPGSGLRAIVRDPTSPAAFDLPGLPQLGFDGESVFSTGFSVRSSYRGLLYNTASPIPSAHAGITLGWSPVAFGQAATRIDGRAAWSATFGVAEGTPIQRMAQSIGIVTDIDGPLTLVAATGGLFPTPPWNVVFTKVSASPLLTDEGSVVFVGAFGGAAPGNGVFLRKGTFTERVVGTGDTIDGVTVGRVLEPIAVSADGDVVWTATLAGAAAGANVGVFVRGSDGVSRLVLRRGDAAPALTGGEAIDGFGPVVVSSRGLVATVIRLRGPGVTGTNNSLLVVETRSGAFAAGVRTGSLFTPPGTGSARTVKRILLGGGGLGYASYTRGGRAVFGLEFSDSSRGLFSTDVECQADVNEDGLVDSDDILAFFVAWEGLLPAADADGSGAIDSDDVVVFFAHLEAGC